MHKTGSIAEHPQRIRLSHQHFLLSLSSLHPCLLCKTETAPPHGSISGETSCLVCRKRACFKIIQGMYKDEEVMLLHEKAPEIRSCAIPTLGKGYSSVGEHLLHMQKDPNSVPGRGIVCLNLKKVPFIRTNHKWHKIVSNSELKTLLTFLKFWLPLIKVLSSCGLWNA